MESKLLILLFSSFFVCHVSSYVVTWTGDDEVRLHSKHLLGQEVCTRGPGYWCHNITHAKECNAIHHCIDKVWEKMTVPEDNDSVCQICKDMVKQARDQLLSNETQEELREVLEGSCKLIPLKIISKECCTLADEFIPELVDTLASRMDPNVVCTVSGLCNSARIDKMLEEMNPEKEKKFDLSKNPCPKCNHYMGKAFDFLKELPENELLEKALMMCGQLGSYSDSCSAMVFAQMDGLYQHLQNQVNSEEFCGLVGLCEVTGIRRVHIGQSSTAVRAWSPPKGDDVPCDFCKQLIAHLKEWLLANTTKDEFRDLLRGICKQTGNFRKECLNLAQQYGKVLYQLLVDEANPRIVCGQIGVCPNPGKFQLFGKPLDGPIMTILPVPEKKIDFTPRLDLLPGEKLAGAEESLINADEAPRMDLGPAEALSGAEESKINGFGDITPMVSLLPAERLAGDDEIVKRVKNKNVCELCELLLHELQVEIMSNKTLAEITEAVDHVCDKLPGEFADDCRTFVDSYGASLVVLIAQRIDPSVMCPKLGICPGSDGLRTQTPPPESERQSILKLDRRPATGELPSCAMCHIIARKVIDLVGTNRTKIAIDKALDSICYLTPIYDHLRDKCFTFMTNYGNQIGEMLVMEGTAREICFALHLCVIPLKHASDPDPAPKIVVESSLPFDRFMPSTILQDEISNIKKQHPELTLDENEIEKPVNGGGNRCVLCEFVMDKLEERIKDKSTEEEIKEEVEGICQYLPRTVSSRCRSFIDAYGDMIIDYLANAESAEQICQQLGLCDKSVRLSKVELQKLEEIEDVSMGRCQLCIVISDYLSAMLEDPKVDTSIDSIVEKICPIMPKKYRENCHEVIEDYGPYLLSLLAQETDKGKACQIVSLCPGSKNPLLV